MKKLFRISLILLAVLMLLALCSCESENGKAYPNDEIIYDAGVGGSTSTGKDNVTGSADYQAKIIRTARLSAESKEFDAARKALTELIATHGGYIASSSESGESRRQSRSLSLTIRLPAENLDAFLASVGNVLHLTRSSVESDDVTLQYYDVQSRLSTLRAEKSALDAMLASAATTQELIAINERLFDVIEEIEALQTQMNVLEDKVAKATVYLSVSEVSAFSPEDESFGTRIKNAFVSGWTSFAEFWVDFAVWFVESLPVLLMLGAFGTGVGFLLRHLVRRKKRHTTLPPLEKEQEEQE